MSLLASGISRGETITVVILCTVAVILILINAFLVISLHRQNNKLVKRSEASRANSSENADSEEKPENEQLKIEENNFTDHNI